MIQLTLRSKRRVTLPELPTALPGEGDSFATAASLFRLAGLALPLAPLLPDTCVPILSQEGTHRQKATVVARGDPTPQNATHHILFEMCTKVSF